MTIFVKMIPQLFLSIGVIVLLSTLTACPSKTYYLRDEDNGFVDSKISDTTYTISVHSMNAKDTQRLQDIFYLRAAEIARDANYPFFYTLESAAALAENDPKAKPFKQRILTLVLYQTITISGVVKLLKEAPTDFPFQVINTDSAFRKREYLIIEKENVFGKDSEKTPETSKDIQDIPVQKEEVPENESTSTNQVDPES